MTVTGGLIVELGSVKPIRWAGESGRWLLRGEDTGGLYSFFEVSSPAGEGPPPHIHEDVDESFYVIEGEYEISLGEEKHKAGPGSLVYGPRRVVHSFVNTWHGTSKMLCIATPGGIETWFEELGQLLAGGGPPDWDRMQELASRHRITGLRPPGEAPGQPGRIRRAGVDGRTEP